MIEVSHERMFKFSYFGNFYQVLKIFLGVYIFTYNKAGGRDYEMFSLTEIGIRRLEGIREEGVFFRFVSFRL